MSEPKRYAIRFKVSALVSDVYVMEKSSIAATDWYIALLLAREVASSHYGDLISLELVSDEVQTAVKASVSCGHCGMRFEAWAGNPQACHECLVSLLKKFEAYQEKRNPNMKPKRYLIRLKSDDLLGSGSVEANDWTEALSKAILKASHDGVELTGIELIQEPGGVEAAPKHSGHQEFVRCVVCDDRFARFVDEPYVVACQQCQQLPTEEIKRRMGIAPAPDVQQQILMELIESNCNLNTLIFHFNTLLGIMKHAPR